MIFPWPSRQQRKAAISRARSDKEQSRADAASAALIQAEIEQLTARNHFAGLIAEQIMRGAR